ncbi:MAG TPA: TetR/AcrR family transcriptional regulator, partial [Solirubrobacteraceae bacterium]|nr:TetR/AcrR family transcriptional regulator [Solirubrobacteraceae bacterium]
MSFDSAGGTVDRREDLVRAALELFAERPYEEVSVDDVAAAAGVAKGLLYYYFGSKRRLYVKGLELVARERRERILAAVAAVDPENQVERLERSIEAHLAYVEERAAGYRALVGNVASHPEVREIIERERRVHTTMIEAGLPPEV